jgi:hypothetical protein
MMIRSTSVVVFQILLLLAISLLPVASGYSCLDPQATGRCCFRRNGDDLRAAASDYDANGINSTAAQTYGAVIGDWCVNYVRDFSNVFLGLETFNEPLTNWNTSSAVTMRSMFDEGAIAFNQPVQHFDTRRVTNMNSMFASALAFNQPSNFNTSQVTIPVCHVFWSVRVQSVLAFI